VRPLATGFFEWARGARGGTQGRNLATKALEYAVNQEAELMRVLDDVELPLENTRSERALPEIVIGRKAWMFYGPTRTQRPPRRSSASSLRAAFITSIRSHIWRRSCASCRTGRGIGLELAPKYWQATRARLNPDELTAPLLAFEIPPPDPAPPAVARPSAS